MTTGNKSALGAVRIASLAGLSATALLIGMASAQAQTVTANGAGATGAALTTNGLTGVILNGAEGTPITGFTFSDISGGSTTINNTGVNITGTSALSVGNLGQATIGATGNIATTGTLTVNGLSSFGSTGQATIGTNGYITTSGTVQGGTLTDGIASLTAGSLTGAVNGAFSGTVTGGTLTDGTASLHAGSLTDAVNGTFSGTVQAGTLGVTNNATVGGTLGVTGNTTLGGNLGVTGDYTTTNGNVTTTNGTIMGKTVSAGSGGLVSSGGAAINGVSTFTNTGTPGQGTTMVNGGVVTASSGLGSITLNAAADPIVTIQNTGATSTTTITDGQIKSEVTGGGSTIINGGTVTVSGTYYGNVTGLSGNQAVTVNGGQVVNNGLIVNGGSILNDGATVNGNTKLNGNLTVQGPSNGGAPVDVSMGGNVVHDVAAPVVGTDAANKAYVDKGVNKAFEGTAIALSLEQPIFLPGQSFAMRAGWGEFESQNAFGVSAAGVIARDVLGYGSTVVVDAGIGAGSNYNTVAGKAGVTLGFGGAAAPLK